MPPQVIHVKNASKVASALANEKCRKILDYLGKHPDATETKLSKELSIPLSTVHYNMKVLSEAKLILDNEYTYSPKGKEVTHYRLNKNPIVIVQEEQQLEILKAIVPATFIAAGIGVAWSLLRTPPPQDAGIDSTRMMIESAPAAADAAPEAADAMMMKSADLAAQVEPSAIVPADILPWFLAGVVTVLFTSLLVVMIMRWWNQRK